MTLLFVILLVLVYVPALGMMFVYSLNLYYLILLALWPRSKKIGIEVSGETPFVTVQIPLYNERYVSQRIIDTVAKLDWPLDRLQIQILDDSTDETKDIVAEAVKHWQEQGIPIEQIRRPDRVGYKAGALAYGLTRARGDYIAIFDADFVPRSDFLRQTLPILLEDPKAAFIQARWEHLNRQSSWLTRIQAIAIDGHFAVEQLARYHSGFPFNFNGTAGVWRRKAIEDAGGWQSNTLTEDLDLSYRAWLRGWRGLYRHDVSSPAELPPTMTAFRRQQARWAQGSIECAGLLLPKVWRSRYSVLAKIQASIHLLAYLVNPIMVSLVILYPLMILFIQQQPELNTVFTMFNAIGPLTFAPTAFFLFSQFALRRTEWRSLVAIWLFQVISTGLAMNTLRATLKALVGQRGEFLRTPKWGSSSPTKSGYRVKADVGVFTDVLWGFACIAVVILSLNNHHYFMTLYAGLSCIGTWWVGLWTVWPDLAGTQGALPAALTSDSTQSA